MDLLVGYVVGHFFCWFCFMVWIIEGGFWIAKSTAFGNYVSLLICYSMNVHLFYVREKKKWHFFTKVTQLLSSVMIRCWGEVHVNY